MWGVVIAGAAAACLICLAVLAIAATSGTWTTRPTAYLGLLVLVFISAIPVVLVEFGLRPGAAADTAPVRATQGPEASRLLVVSAHPDDLELACGGTVARLAAQGSHVKVLVMSSGTVGGDPAARRREAVAGAAVLGVHDVTVLDFADTRLADHSRELIEAIEAVAVAFRPTVVLTHSEHDQHQDHHAVNRAVVRACRQAPTILGFESPSATRAFNPSVFVDIDGFLDLKVRAVASHVDQAGKPYMTAARVRGVAAFRGTQAKRVHAEGFEPVRYTTSLQEASL
ncbi:PIG-L deacetylase family protein [Serinibacter salmoneus]|uniref:PIG-L deacetylase family protein n=1 Tax=Serinibacter salmoneus TaxID=556530 RepID=UPI00147417C2|nr:PIG-L deacetylase family protein [Serinibacter salmoneus]